MIKNRRFISGLLALIMVLGLLLNTGMPVFAAEAEGSVHGGQKSPGMLERITDWWFGNIWKKPEASVNSVASGWTGANQWTLSDDGVLTVYGSGAMKNYGYNGGQPWQSYADQIKSVVIEEGVTSVGQCAFMKMPALESVSLPDTMTKMGEAAFYGCTRLTSVEIPASLWTIQPYTFKNCTALQSVTFHEGNLIKISDGAFYGTGLTELVLPDCLDILDVYAFKGCSKLTSITIGSGLTELREAVFYGTGISTITIPEGITKIGPYAFKNCVSLETVDLPSTLTSVGEASFYACSALKAIDLPDAVTTIGNYAFRRCAAMTSLNLSAQLVSIGECSFYGCAGLTSLVIPDKVTTILPYAFKTCTGLTNVILGESVASIGEGAFNTCTGLKTIVFPASLTAIGDYCFSNSLGIWKLTFRGDAPAIGTGAFKGLSATAYYPADNATWTSAVKQNYGGKLTWTEASGEEVDDEVPSGIYVRNVTATGDTVDVAVCIKDNPGVLGMTLSVSYDESALTLTGASNGAAFAPLTLTKAGSFKSGCRFLWDGLELAPEEIIDGEMLVLTFAVSDQAAGKYLIDLTAGDIYNNNIEAVVIAVTDGYVTVS